MFKTKIKKEDQVVVISGSDKGKRGKVLFVDNEKNRVLVEGVNKKKKHIKKAQSPNGQGGILDMEFPMKLSKVMFFCEKCKKGVRVGKEISGDNKYRICRKCGKRLD
ncbi:MAG: 50S ribosomal protein L24 [Spirochaetes bacterium]|nr:50S ribosomal protein L24 [Spirochaetota bacterium]MBN2769133.1 50S ribosomal protein L24 [Spirochaetota bacterium]HRX15361.1 50S ribosomal protein L24 [Spirochaetota bacterium]